MQAKAAPNPEARNPDKLVQLDTRGGRRRGQGWGLPVQAPRGQGAAPGGAGERWDSPAPRECPGPAAAAFKGQAGQEPKRGGENRRGIWGPERAGAGPESRRGAMAGRGPGWRQLLLLVLLAGAAQGGLYFRPGQTCYRPLRGDPLAPRGRRWAPAGRRPWGDGRPSSRAGRALCLLGALPRH
ncbi:hypothetical protein P7K49_009994 [Saguinus oedipus]|uniref:Uncharacterized protein n=1 Tax=Saguinus oedipus TaxID=9490 RepID=A0ABQ9VLJ3_SAGOE|nr:hypothetical protein P7K49_009994 [Saguinus oedipus]